jgi:hypothetical protein
MIRGLLPVAPAILMLALLPSAARSQNLVPNGSFDSDVTGWQPDAPLPPNTTFSWNPSAGVPAGSAFLESAYNGNAIIKVSSVCIPAQGPGNYRLVADLFGEPAFGADCSLVLEQNEDAPDCSIDRQPSSNVAPFDVGVWNHIDEMIGIGPLTQAFRIRFYVVRYPGQTHLSRCGFDNIALYGPVGPVVSVPALGSMGLVCLALALALIGLRTIRS